MIRSKKRFFIKTIIKLLFFLLLIIVTLINAFHIDNGFSSTDLTLKTTKIDAGTRHDYLDSEGNITLATDKGYASIIEKHISDRESIFQYLDENGVSIKLYGGYDTIYRTYTSAGKAETDTYFIVNVKSYAGVFKNAA